MKRADIARRRLVGDAAMSAAHLLGLPWTHEARAEMALAEVIYRAENGYGYGIGRVTARKARKDFTAIAALVVEALPGYDECEERNRMTLTRLQR